MLSFLLTLLAVAYSEASDVLILTDSNFESTIQSESLILVKFYAPWCGHCQKLAPVFESAATRLAEEDPSIKLAKLDCTEEKSTCSKFGVQGYPTLKWFKNGVASDYNGGREEGEIVKYMKGKAGPVSLLLKTQADFDAFTSTANTVIVGTFTSEESSDYKTFMGVASSLSEDFKFGHVLDAELAEKLNAKNKITIYYAKKFHSKFEPKQLQRDASETGLNEWITDNVMGIAGVLTSSNAKYFDKVPLVVAYYNVDYTKDPKGTNYIRNRLMKVVQKIEADRHTKLYMAVANSQTHASQLEEFGVTSSDNNAVTVTVKDAKKYKMAELFSVANLEAFLVDYLDGKLTPYLKSESIPEENDGPVKTVVASTFDAIVNDPTKDVLIEFYAPWCGHCKSLAPKYKQLGEEMLATNPDIVVAKMDATANDVPAPYEVSGFPTIYFAPKDGKSKPILFSGDREVKGFVKFLKKHASQPVKTEL